MAKQWMIQTDVDPKCEQLSRHLGVSALVAKLLLNRGMGEAVDAKSFLLPQLKDLHAPDKLPGATRAAGLLAQAVADRRKIVLYGDYDVDGTTGVAVLWHLLRFAGAEVSFYVPHRVEEGYGLNLDAVRRLVADGAGLIVTVDCGITAAEEVAAVKEAGAQVIVTDHHIRHEVLPEADAIVHPCVEEGYPNEHLCGAGVAFKVAWATAQRLCGAQRVTAEYRALLMSLLPLAALGTIADVVPLVGENRIIAKHGLESLPNTPLAGLRALMVSAGLEGGRVSGFDVGFKLAPRLNAAGRMGHARLAVELLTRADAARAQEIALYLEDHNRARQATERKIARQAFDLIEQQNLASDARRAIVLAAEGWHPGVIGIVASRVVDRYHRPTVLIALNGDEGQGSGRSVRHFDLAEALGDCGKHLLAYGGHAMAAGLRIAADETGAFTEAFVEVANQRLTAADLIPKLRLDADVELSELTMETAQQMVALGPFGVGNPRPKLATGWIELADEPRCVGKSGTHLSAVFGQSGVRLRGIGFGLHEHLEDLKQHRRCRVAFEPIVNEFNGRRSVEMQILDFEFPK